MYTGEAPLSNVTQPNVSIPDPPAGKPGPAQQFIPSVATATRINPKSNQAIEQKNIFTPGQTFYLTFSVQPPQGQTGEVVTKWYTNDHFYYANDPKKSRILPAKSATLRGTCGLINQPQAALNFTGTVNWLRPTTLRFGTNRASI